jgi:hypothetical protein
VSGNATVLAGDRIETGTGPALIVLRDGTRVLLSAGAAGSVFADNVALERGTGEVTAASPFQISALNLRVATAARGSSRTVITPSGILHVDSVQGNVQVKTGQGTLVARLDPNASFDFTPSEDQAVAPTKLTGVVRKAGDSFVVQDEISKVVFELRGEHLGSLVGHRVQLEGMVVAEKSQAADASQVIHVAKAVKVDRASPIVQAKHLPTAVIAGVGVAAAAASAGILASEQGGSNTVSPSSR